MALARKNTRRIVVESVVFRWTVSPDDEPGVAIVVELFEEPAGRLVCWMPHGVRITPKVVADQVRHALDGGWRPSSAGPDFVVRVSEEQLAEVHDVSIQCPCCDSFTLSQDWGWEICPVCFWECDSIDLEKNLHQPSGPNHGLTLAEARANFEAFGACSWHMVKNVLPPDKSAGFRRVRRFPG